VAGNPDSCAALGRELDRAAFQVADGGAQPEPFALMPGWWSGAAASSWQLTVTSRAVRAERLAEQLSVAGRTMRDVAEQLVELQARAARLASAAADEGLVMDADGSIAPVPVLYGPFTGPVALAEQQRAVHRAEVRSGLLHQVAQLRRDEDGMHVRLVRDLQGVAVPWGAGPRPRPTREESAQERKQDDNSWYEPTWWDTAAVLGVLRTTPLKDLSLSSRRPGAKAVALVRTVPGMALVTGAIGVAGDLVEGYSLPGALLKEGVVGVSSATAGITAGVALVAVLGPGVVAVAGAVVVGAAVGYGMGKAWDAVAKPTDEPAADRESRERAPAKAVPQPPQPPVAVPLDPTCGRGPVLSQAS